MVSGRPGANTCWALTGPSHTLFILARLQRGALLGAGVLGNHRLRGPDQCHLQVTESETETQRHRQIEMASQVSGLRLQGGSVTRCTGGQRVGMWPQLLPGSGWQQSGLGGSSGACGAGMDGCVLATGGMDEAQEVPSSGASGDVRGNCVACDRDTGGSSRGLRGLAARRPLWCCPRVPPATAGAVSAGGGPSRPTLPGLLHDGKLRHSAPWGLGPQPEAG